MIVAHRVYVTSAFRGPGSWSCCRASDLAREGRKLRQPSLVKRSHARWDERLWRGNRAGRGGDVAHGVLAARVPIKIAKVRKEAENVLIFQKRVLMK